MLHVFADLTGNMELEKTWSVFWATLSNKAFLMTTKNQICPCSINFLNQDYTQMI